MAANRAKSTAGNKGRMVNICTGFTAGGSSLTADGEVDHSDQSATEVGPLVHPDDPAGWHDLPVQHGRPQARRARRTDVWRAESSKESSDETECVTRCDYRESHSRVTKKSIYRR